MNVKALIPLVAGLVVGLLALKLGSDYLRKAQGSSRPAAQTVQVWAAGQDIGRGQAVTEEMLRTVSFDAKTVPAGTFTDKAQVIGRVARAPRVSGDLLFEESLMPAGTTPGLPVPEGYRAVGVKIDESSGVDYHLEPGGRVDVVAYFTTDTRGSNSTVARTIIEDVEVGAVGPRISAVETDKSDAKPAGQREDRVVRAVTLFVKPTDVPLLFQAESRGRIKLSLRSEADAGHSSSRKAVDERDLLGEPAPRTPSEGWPGLIAGPPAPTPTVAAAPPPPPATPKWAHTTVVVNNKHRAVFGWKTLDSAEPVELTNDGAPAQVAPAGHTTTPPAPAPAPAAAPVHETNEPAPKEPAE
jgi:pilus assembly protein CpaB